MQRLLQRNIPLRTGDLYPRARQTESLNSLVRMGVFRYVNVAVSRPDTLSDVLDITLDAAMDTPMEAWFEANVTSSTNSFIGPGVIFGLAHNNVFGGGERLSLELTGSYEWQTGKRQATATRSSLLNSYEFGLKASLAFPRLLPSALFWNSRVERRYGGKTTVQLSAELMNRPQYFRMMSLNTSFAFDFQSSATSSHTLQLPKIGYNYRTKAAHHSDRPGQDNPVSALRSRKRMFPTLCYTGGYNCQVRHHAADHHYLGTSAYTAGNLLARDVSGTPGEKKFLGIPFSQFAKATTDFRYYRRLWGDVELATRFLVGAGWAYGNSSVLPYSEQFYIGGPNSIRAFTIRTVGPGSYAPPQDQVDAYLDQTGNFKLESNVELRFPILGDLHVAVVLDAGNIWLLKAEANRPGGTLNKKTFWRDIALGTGVGLRYDISFLILRLDMGIGLHAPYNNDKPHYYNMDSFGKSLAFHLAIGYPF